VCCSVLQCVAVCCSVLQTVDTECASHKTTRCVAVCHSVSQRVAACRSVSQLCAVCQHSSVPHTPHQCVLQRVAACCSVYSRPGSFLPRAHSPMDAAAHMCDWNLHIPVCDMIRVIMSDMTHEHLGAAAHMCDMTHVYLTRFSDTGMT